MNNEHFEYSEAYEALNEYIDCLLAEKRAILPAGLSRSDLILYVLAAELKGIQPGADIPREEFLAHLKASIDREIARRNRQQPPPWP